jgi:WD40 repeat protein
MVVTRDGRRAYIGCNDGSIRVWDLEEGVQVARFEDQKGCTYCLALSNDERFLASGGTDKIVRVWDAKTGEVISRGHGHTAAIDDVQFSPEGGWVVSSSFDRSIRCWATANGAEIRKFTAPVDFRASAVSLDGALVAGAGEALNVPIRVWNVHSNNLLRTIDGHLSANPKAGEPGAPKTHCVVTYLRFLPDRQLISCGNDNAIRIWDCDSGREVHNFSFDSGVWRFTVSDDGRRAVTGHGDGSVRVWMLPYRVARRED